MSAEKVAVWLTKKDTQVLRRLIVEEARRHGLNELHPDEPIPRRFRPLKTVAIKIWEARQHFNG